jgi:hypothetical protein
MLGIKEFQAFLARKRVDVERTRIEFQIILILIIIAEIDVSVLDKAFGDEQVMGFIPCQGLGGNDQPRKEERIDEEGQAEQHPGCLFRAETMERESVPSFARKNLAGRGPLEPGQKEQMEVAGPRKRHGEEERPDVSQDEKILQKNEEKKQERGEGEDDRPEEIGAGLLSF